MALSEMCAGGFKIRDFVIVSSFIHNCPFWLILTTVNTGNIVTTSTICRIYIGILDYVSAEVECAATGQW